jgi:hypothetical protein
VESLAIGVRAELHAQTSRASLTCKGPPP